MQDFYSSNAESSYTSIAPSEEEHLVDQRLTSSRMMSPSSPTNFQHSEGGISTVMGSWKQQTQSSFRNMSTGKKMSTVVPRAECNALSDAEQGMRLLMLDDCREEVATVPNQLSFNFANQFNRVLPSQQQRSAHRRRSSLHSLRDSDKAHHYHRQKVMDRVGAIPFGHDDCMDRSKQRGQFLRRQFQEQRQQQRLDSLSKPSMAVKALPRELELSLLEEDAWKSISTIKEQQRSLFSSTNILKTSQSWEFPSPVNELCQNLSPSTRISPLVLFPTTYSTTTLVRGN